MSSKTNDGLKAGVFTNIQDANLTALQVIATDASNNLVSIPSLTSGYVLTSNGTNAPTFQSMGAYSGVMAVVNGGTGVTTSTGSGSTVLNTTPTLITPVLGVATATSLTTGAANITGLTASQMVATDASKNLVSVATTGSGLNVLQTSPTLITPVLGAASATSLTASTGLCCNSAGVTGTGAGIYYWTTGATQYTTYMAAPGAAKSLNGGTACSGGSVTNFAIRNRMDISAGFGWIWENNSEGFMAGIDSQNGNATFSGYLATNAPTTLVVGSTSGSCTFTQPMQGASYKKVIMKLTNLNGTASYTFPTAFTNTPVTLMTSGLATTLVTTLTTTACTVTGSLSSGILIIEGF